jgi:hypothetical protein
MILLLAVLAAVQGRGPDPKAVDAAIEKGVRWLKSAPSSGYEHQQIADCDELILLTMVHAGVPPTDGRCQELLQKMQTAPLEKTYKVVLQAMVLEEVDRVKHQRRIAQCGQFLVDSQCANGQWSYGQASAFLDSIPEPTPGRGAVATSGARPVARKPAGKGTEWAKPEVVKRIVLQKKADGPGSGDNSNSQYAALGLRACAEAGVAVPRETLERARKWWIGSQQAVDARGGRKPVASGEGVGGAPAGWCYGDAGHGHPPYGSMTAGAVGAMVIYDHLLGLSWKKDESVLRGLAWMSVNFSVTSNPGPAEWGGGAPGYMLYYYLYALERVGVFTGLERLGGQAWYAAGARAILAEQSGDGSWVSQAPEANATWDTCFAILFLKRATRPLEDVASVDALGR